VNDERRPTSVSAAQPLAAQLETIVRDDPHLMRLLLTARELDLPQWRLAAGCVYQTVWNALTGRPRGTGINDYDLLYFDAEDLSRESEAEIESRLQNAVSGLPARVEIRNQARVHLWFEEYFGIAYSPLSSADEAITRYATISHAVGLRLTAADQLDVFAPFGLEDIFAMIVRPNYALPNQATHMKKAARAKLSWPEVTVIPWT
jgi:uncharacterized protein